MELIYTNDLCTGCNKCVRGCPVLTANIATQEGYVTVDPDKCIACGECFDVCPHEARDYYDDTDRFFEDLASGKKISVILAPAFLANYPKEYQRVLLGGLTCDSEDFYNSESHINAIFLPKLEPGNPQYIGFFRGHSPAVSGSSHLCGKIYTGADSASDAGTQSDDVYCYLYEKIHAGHR